MLSCPPCPIIPADSLALAVGILRQHQPLDAHEDDVQLSERLRDFLRVLSKRPASTAATPAQPTPHAAAGNGPSTVAHTAAGVDSLPGMHAGNEVQEGCYKTTS